MKFWFKIKGVVWIFLVIQAARNYVK